MPLTVPGLFVVATPLGNLGDLSTRAREVLESADLLLSEDTRRAGLLMQRLGLRPPPMRSFFEHNEEHRLEPVLELLRQGKRIALITDAGTPLLADPGYLLVRACRGEGLPVTPVPGPCAVTTALMACGLPPYPYTFLGFLPRKSGERRALFAQYARLRCTLVFFERKDRVFPALEDAYRELGPREFCIARELTKAHEEFILGRLDALHETRQELLGEITLCIAPPERGEADGTSREMLFELIREEQERGGSPKEVARRVKERAEGVGVKQIYALMQHQR